MTNQKQHEWVIYLRDEGHWPIAYDGDDEAEARRVYLRWAGRERLPAGSAIYDLVQTQG